MNKDKSVTKNYVIKRVEKANDFIGIKIENDSIVFHVPAFFRGKVGDMETKTDLLLFLKSIMLAKTIDYTNIKQSKLGKNEKVWPIDSYLWIIKDYLQNGYFYNREKTYTKNSNGKIEWKKTLKTQPIISNKNIIYNQLVTSKMAPTNDLIAQIYKICLYYSQKRIGWLFNYNFHVVVPQHKSVQEMIKAVEKVFSSTYDDLKWQRYKHMLIILKGMDTDDALSNYVTYGVENYYYAFEQMVDQLFKGIKGKEKQKYNPTGYWDLIGYDEFPSSDLRPDTIYKTENETIIIDAKMYQYGATRDIRDLPNSSSIQKQIVYGEYVKNRIDTDLAVRNVFILPYDKENKNFAKDIAVSQSEDKNFVYIGKARGDWGRQLNDYETIYTFMIDFNYLLNNYRKDNDVYVRKMIKKINELIKGSN